MDTVIVAMRATVRPATQKSFCVEISRVRNEALLLTEDPERLAKPLPGRPAYARPLWISGWRGSWQTITIIGFPILAPRTRRSGNGQCASSPIPSVGRATVLRHAPAKG